MIQEEQSVIGPCWSRWALMSKKGLLGADLVILV